MLIERLQRHFANDFPNSEFSISQNEMLLYIDEAVPVVMKGQMFENAKVTGFLENIESYLVTYNFTVSTQNSSTKEWSITLPQVPLALPNGYNISDAYFADPVNGKGSSLYFVSSKRASYASDMPSPTGVFARLEGKTVYMKSSDGGSLFNYTIWIQMPITRTSDIDAAFNVPDDAISGIFAAVTARIAQRLQLPQDIVKDNLPSGNKSS